MARSPGRNPSRRPASRPEGSCFSRRAIAGRTGGDNVTVTAGELETGFYIEDDGFGIPEAERDDVFEPGFSTNPDGTGLGLRIAKQVAEAHNWKM